MIKPVQQFDAHLLLQAQGKTERGIRAVIFDVDGVLTDGSLLFTEDGETIKNFSVLDGLGLELLKKAGLEIIVITGRDSAPLRRRLNDFGIKHVHYGVKNKLTAAKTVLNSLAISWDETAVIGDDWLDIPLFMRAALAVAPMNAHVETKAVAHYISEKKGGQGAVREFCDIILIAGGHYDHLFREYAQLELEDE